MTNVYEYEHGIFDRVERQKTVSKIIVEYNGIIDDYESDTSLKIDIG